MKIKPFTGYIIIEPTATKIHSNHVFYTSETAAKTAASKIFEIKNGKRLPFKTLKVTVRPARNSTDH